MNYPYKLIFPKLLFLFLSLSLTCTTAKAQFVQLGGDINGFNMGDRFGEEIFLSGDGQHIAISAARGDTARGEVRVYAYDGSNWQQRGAPFVSGNNSGEFGNDVALSADGSRLVIAHKYDNTTADSAGMVATYNWNGSSWTAAPTLYGSQSQQLFGASLALSSDGQTMIVGAPQYRNSRIAPAPPEGRAIIYKWLSSSNNWTVSQNIEGDNNNHSLGSTVDISPDGNDIILTHRTLSLMFGFDSATNIWRANAACAGDSPIDFGRSLALSNSVTIPNYTNPLYIIGTQGKEIYLYGPRHFNFTGPVLTTNLSSSDNELYGYAVDINATGDRMIIGAPNYSSSTDTALGRATIYQSVDVGYADFWQPIFTANGDQANGECGRSVSISDDGRYIAVGCAGQQNSSGTVRVFFVPALSVATLPEAKNFKIYPNPAQDVLFLERADLDKNATLAITNTLGQVLIQANINSNLNEISIQSLPQGAYFARISMADGLISSQKIIKN